MRITVRYITIVLMINQVPVTTINATTLCIACSQRNCLRRGNRLEAFLVSSQVGYRGWIDCPSLTRWLGWINNRLLVNRLCGDPLAAYCIGVVGTIQGNVLPGVIFKLLPINRVGNIVDRPGSLLGFMLHISLPNQVDVLIGYPFGQGLLGKLIILGVRGEPNQYILVLVVPELFRPVRRIANITGDIRNRVPEVRPGGWGQIRRVVSDVTIVDTVSRLIALLVYHVLNKVRVWEAE